MEGSLIPANTKKSTLILGMFRLFPDVAIAAGGTVLTVLLLFIVSGQGTLSMILALLPMFIGAFLVLPMPNYHNMLCCIQSILNFYNGRKKYIWRGWCLRYEYSEQKKQ